MEYLIDIPKSLEPDQQRYVKWFILCFGNAEMAALRARIPYETVCHWFEHNPVFYETVHTDGVNAIVELVQEQLIKEVREGSLDAMIAYLRIFARDRGYGRSRIERRRKKSKLMPPSFRGQGKP